MPSDYPAAEELHDVGEKIARAHAEQHETVLNEAVVGTDWREIAVVRVIRRGAPERIQGGPAPTGSLREHYSMSLPDHDIYDRQGDLYDGIDAPENRLVTLYDSEFDSLGAREVSQFVYPGETNALKAVEQREE